MKNIDNLIDICNKMGWNTSCDPDDDMVEIGQGSPAGEDFSFTVSRENFVRDVVRYANNFDPDEHAEMWICNRSHTSGVPDASTLIEDAKAIKDMLDDLAEALQNGAFEKRIKTIKVVRHSSFETERFGPIRCDTGNMSTIYDKLIRLSAKLTESYASDILFYYDGIEATKDRPQIRLLTFRENGVNQLVMCDLDGLYIDNDLSITITSDDRVNGIYRQDVWKEMDSISLDAWKNLQTWALVILGGKASLYRVDIRK